MITSQLKNNFEKGPDHDFEVRTWYISEVVGTHYCSYNMYSGFAFSTHGFRWQLPSFVFKAIVALPTTDMNTVDVSVNDNQPQVLLSDEGILEVSHAYLPR